jgi:hypothetical protein
MTGLRLASNLVLPPDAVTETFGILAVRGAGKSNTAAVMAEEMFHAKLPFVVVDPVRTWWGIRASRDGTGPGLAVPIFGGRRADVPLERGGGSLLADLVVDSRLSCVLDLSDFESEAAKKAFLLDFARRLYQRNEAPLHLFLEEADDYIPQKPMKDELQLLRAWENIIRRGRNRGLGCTLITQRSAVINKDVLYQVQTLIPMRTTGPGDIDTIARWVRYHHQPEDILASLPSLEDGEAWVWSPHFLKKTVRVRFRLRETFDSGATPKVASQTKAPATLADVDLGAIRTKMAATIERAKAEDPRELRRQLAEVKAQLGRAQSAPTSAPAKARRVEVPVLSAKHVTALESAIRRADAAIEKLGAVKDGVQGAITALVAAAKPIADDLKALRVGPWGPRGTAPVVAAHVAPGARVETIRALQRMGTGAVTAVMVSRKTEPGHGLPIGEARILTAIAQHVEGVTREQLSILTGYKRSTRDRYVQFLGQKGLVVAGDRITATAAGVAALGSEFEPLPTGDALRGYWLQRLPEGERKILAVLVKLFPRAVERGAIDEATGYRRSTRDRYIQYLQARKLVVSESRGAVRAAAELFG